jgi:hypothetical protein
MPVKNEKIGPLKKISLSLKVGTNPDSGPFEEIAPAFDFIFGIGTKGLTPFECEISDRAVGEEMTIPLFTGDLGQVFQHIPIPAGNLPADLNRFYLKIRVLDVAEADQREVIRAMADMAACGDGCCGH